MLHTTQANWSKTSRKKPNKALHLTTRASAIYGCLSANWGRMVVRGLLVYRSGGR